MKMVRRALTPLGWRSGVSLSEDVMLRQQWSADVEPLLVAQ